MPDRHRVMTLEEVRKYLREKGYLMTEAKKRPPTREPSEAEWEAAFAAIAHERRADIYRRILELLRKNGNQISGEEIGQFSYLGSMRRAFRRAGLAISIRRPYSGSGHGSWKAGPPFRLMAALDEPGEGQ